MDNNIIIKLIEKAMEARKNSYCPYSGYAVGAALLSVNDLLYKGCNIENASYGATNCAERTAVFKAVSEGETRFKAIAICGGPVNGENDYASPCGVCRQVLREFSNPKDMTVIIAKNTDEYKIFTLEELLPESFGPENLL